MFQTYQSLSQYVQMHSHSKRFISNFGSQKIELVTFYESSHAYVQCSLMCKTKGSSSIP